jgi:hypothetical protein
MWYSNLETKTIICSHILHQHWYSCPIALSVRRNPQHRSFFIVVSVTSAPVWVIICDFRTSLREFLDPVVNRFTRQTLPTANRKHLVMNIPCIESFCPQKTHNRTLLFGGTLHKHGRHFDYWNQPLNLRMRVWYLDYHEAALCCYLVIHIENLLHPLQLFYFHLWPVYWLSLVCNLCSSNNITKFQAITFIVVRKIWNYSHVNCFLSSNPPPPCIKPH